MQLTNDEIAEFDDRGYLLVRALLDDVEVGVLRSAVEQCRARDGAEVVRETNGSGAIRLVYGAHQYSEPFTILCRLPRLLGTVEQLARSRVYIHQSRLNPKEGFSGGTWNWHQDFGTWHREDGIPEPKCVMTAVFLENATAVNSPLLVVPGSQNHGMLSAVSREKDAKGYTVMQIDEPFLRDLAADKGIEALTGPAGTVAFIHCNLVHGSANNISPFPRPIMYLNYNSVDNLPTGGSERAWFHNNPDRTALDRVPDNALAMLARD